MVGMTGWNDLNSKSSALLEDDGFVAVEQNAVIDKRGTPGEN
jgi:hypothetical protein